MHLSTSSIVLARSQDLIRDLCLFQDFHVFSCFFEKSLKTHKWGPKSDFVRPCEEAHRRMRIWCEYLKRNWYLFDNVTVFRDNIWKEKTNIKFSLLSSKEHENWFRMHVWWCLRHGEFDFDGPRGWKRVEMSEKLIVGRHFQICWVGRRHEP